MRIYLGDIGNVQGSPTSRAANLDFARDEYLRSLVKRLQAATNEAPDSVLTETVRRAPKKNARSRLRVQLSQR